MGIFDLPIRQKRLPSSNIFQVGNIFKKYMEEPDYYICYHAGYWARWFSIFFAFIVFSIVYAHHSFGFFPDIMTSTKSNNYLELYSYLIRYTGFFFITFVAYYLYWFFKKIDFKKYNYLRDLVPSGALFERMPKVKLRNLLAFTSIASLVFVIYPAIPTAFFYKVRLIGFFEPYFNNILFIFIVSIEILIIQSFMALASISSILSFLYSQFEIKNLNKRKKL